MNALKKQNKKDAYPKNIMIIIAIEKKIEKSNIIGEN